MPNSASNPSGPEAETPTRYNPVKPGTTRYSVVWAEPRPGQVKVMAPVLVRVLIGRWCNLLQLSPPSCTPLDAPTPPPSTRRRRRFLSRRRDRYTGQGSPPSRPQGCISKVFSFLFFSSASLFYFHFCFCLFFRVLVSVLFH